MSLESNSNTLWASIFVDELVRCGLKHVCIASGSRSTPLTLAFAAHDQITSFVHNDERSSAFFALGIALSTERPVAIVCTSGTALANFSPAILEAFYANTPILVLTADRPHQLRGFGANQTMDQIKLFGDHVKWFVDVSPPTKELDNSTMRYLRTLACRSYSQSLSKPSGPVHINFPFTKPLEPEIPLEEIQPVNQSRYLARNEMTPFVQSIPGELHPTDEQVGDLMKLIVDNPSGLIICGPRCPRGKFPGLISKLSVLLGYPILADITSNVRFGRHIDEKSVISAYETFLQHGNIDHLSQPQLILQFGVLPTSKYLQVFLENLEDSIRIAINDTDQWIDPAKTTTHFIQSKPEIMCEKLLTQIKNKYKEIEIYDAWEDTWQNIDRNTWELIEKKLDNEFFEGSIVSTIFDLIPSNSSVFVSSSLSIRHLDQFVKPYSKNITIYANRGLSGIDGTLSSAIGVAAGLKERVVLITGDLAFYHDLNALLILQRQNIQVIIVLLNNSGGGIFERLPIANYGSTFSKFFVTPHVMDFSVVDELFGQNVLKHSHIISKQELVDQFQSCLASKISHILEFQTDYKRTSQVIKDVVDALLIEPVNL
ncbi:MAG: 2-succinyl-5-enolpyruvyl-6-hydroxy-3-cyclohexene-1-carboxylic-acid synthase [Candidatus Kariarchaeaceae archaeon]|jgi:2-succinyl-5-enolpyruvyl-6-hydroxy-3-cyclohexene-1-carboxylate synthase